MNSLLHIQTLLISLAIHLRIWCDVWVLRGIELIGGLESQVQLEPKFFRKIPDKSGEIGALFFREGTQTKKVRNMFCSSLHAVSRRLHLMVRSVRKGLQSLGLKVKKAKNATNWRQETSDGGVLQGNSKGGQEAARRRSRKAVTRVCAAQPRRKTLRCS